MHLRSLLNTLLASVAAILAMATPAQAALQARDLNGDNVTDAYYDTVLNITWLRNANVNGLMNWANADIWAKGYSFGGYDDWRLPTLNPSDTTCSNTFDPEGGFPLEYYGYDCTGGELSHLFVTDLGNKKDESVLDTTGDTAEQIANLALFDNLESYDYWSGTEYARLLNTAWNFNTVSGLQAYSNKSFELYAMAVRPGDVLAAQVPEPESLLLALTGLGALALVRRRRTVGASVL